MRHYCNYTHPGAKSLPLQRMRQSAGLKRLQYVADLRRKGGMIALSQMATFLAVELKDFYGDMAKPSEVTCENLDCSDN